MIKYFEQNMVKLSTKPQKVTKKIISILPERSFDIIVKRYGLGENPKRLTLESIGQKYKITRERVRQIENNALKNIKKSNLFKEYSDFFEELKNIIHGLGGIIEEEYLLNTLAGKDELEKNYLHFLLVLGDSFFKEKEDDYLKNRWHVDHGLKNKIHEILKQLEKEISKEDLLQEKDIISMFFDKAGDLNVKYKGDSEVAKRWLAISKKINKNHFNEWGLSSSGNISAKGVRDFAYLSIRQHGSPMHFTEVAKAIEKNFGKKAHTATCHNELIKDKRFVLVGRGLYALTEWGYQGGIARDVIKNILKQQGPLTKEEITNIVLRERYIKQNTVAVNLQNTKYFKKNSEGKYTVA